MEVLSTESAPCKTVMLIDKNGRIRGTSRRQQILTRNTRFAYLAYSKALPRNTIRNNGFFKAKTKGNRF